MLTPAGRLTFIAYGIAQPKGSTRAFLPPGARRPIVTADNPKSADWQSLIAVAAMRAIAEAAPWSILTGGVRLTVAFHLPRPVKYRRRPGGLAHVTRPDVDKLLRAVCDALTGVVWRDDAQVTDVIAQKRYAWPDAPPSIVVGIESTGGLSDAVYADRVSDAD